MEMLSDIPRRNLKRASEGLEATKGRNRVIRFINAKVIEAELKAVWEGIDRSLSKFQVSSRLIFVIIFF